MTNKHVSPKRDTVGGNPKKVRDLSDFCQHWPELRHNVVEERLAALDLPDDVRQVVGWLVRLADRVHRDDSG